MSKRRNILFCIVITTVVFAFGASGATQGQSFVRNNNHYLLLKAGDFRPSEDWRLEKPADPIDESHMLGNGKGVLKADVILRPGKYYLYARSKMVTAQTYKENALAQSSASAAGYQVSIDGKTLDDIFSVKPLIMEGRKNRSFLLPCDRFYRWEKSIQPIVIKNTGKYTITISRVKPDGGVPSKISAILLAQKPLRHIPDRDATPKRLQRSLEMQNSLALYDVPNKLLIQTTPRAIPYRNGDNISLLTFYADGYNAEPAQPWELYSFREFPEMFKNNAELEKELKEGVRRNLEALRLKALDKKAHCKYLIANMNLLHIPYWARERFFKCYPSCNPKYIRRHFSEKGFKYPIHPCALSKEAEKLTVGMVDELFANLPLDGLILTIGDNSGNWQCYNDEHKHHKDFLKQSEENNNKEKNTKSTRTTAGAGPGGLYYPDMDYAEKAMLNIIKWVYAGMKKHREKPILLLRAWAGPGLFIGDDSRCNAFLEKVYKIVPKEDFFVVCKHASPPSMDYCWKPASYSPLFNHKSLQKFAILGWGEDQGAKSIVPVSIWYDWPDIIQRDIKWLSAHGMMGTPMGISFSGSRPEQELSHVAAGCLLRDPDLDLKALKKRWATYRFGEKAGAHVLAAIEYGPKILEKHTLYHKGEEQMDSLHFLSLDGKSHYRNQRAAPPWLKVVNQENYQELRERLDATAAAEAMLQEIKLAQKLRPEDEMIELYVRKAQATVYLANWFRDFHHAYLHRRMYFELKDKNRDASLEHVRQGLKLYKSALAELALYANTSPSFGVLGDMYNKMLKATNGWSDRMRKITDAEGEYHE